MSQQARLAEPLQRELVVHVSRDAAVGPGSLYLKPLPGGLHGKAAAQELFRAAPGRDTVRVPLPELAARLAQYSALARSDRSNPGELVSPRDLGLARIGVFYEPLVRDPGCIDVSTRLQLNRQSTAMLVYVDGPGSVRGVRYAQPWIMEYQLEFPAAGVYAVIQRRRGLHVNATLADAAQLQALVRRGACHDTGSLAASP